MIDARRGGIPTSNSIDPKMMTDIQIVVSRQIGKASQLLGNFTTNLVETWVHMRMKFDGGKVINRSQSGSFEHCWMGAGLLQNLRPSWGPQTLEAIISSGPNERYTLSGLTISKQSPWIAASPDGMVTDPSYTPSD